MFSWVGKLFFKQTDLFCVYSIKERQIYEYFDGEKVVKVDPMVLYRKIMDVGPELSVDMKVATSQSKDAVEAHNKAIEKLRKAFSLKSFIEGGLTEIETIDLLNHFMEYTEAIKKKSKTLQTSEINSGLSPTILEHPGQPMTPTLLSGSTVSVSTSAGPMSMPTESELPLAK